MTMADPLGLHSISVPDRGRFLAVPPLDEETLSAVLRAHQVAQGSERCLKRSRGRSITRVRGPWAASDPRATPEEIVVKEQRLPWRWRMVHWLGWPTRFSREHAKGQRLRRLGIEVPRFLAASSRPRRGASFLLTGYLSGGNLRDHVWHGSDSVQGPGELDALLAGAGAWLRGLHDRGVWQRDMKPDNIIVRFDSERGLGFALIDIADVRFVSGPLGRARRVRNLGQVLDLPRRYDEMARAPLLAAYLASDAEANLVEWHRLVDDDIESRRSERHSCRGIRYVDEEPMFRGTL